MSNLPRMRTIKKCVEHFRNEDPETSVNEYQIRQIVKNNSFLAVMSGKKYLVDLDKLIEYFACPEADKQEHKQEPKEETKDNVIKIRESRGIRVVPE